MTAMPTSAGLRRASVMFDFSSPVVIAAAVPTSTLDILGELLLENPLAHQCIDLGV